MTEFASPFRADLFAGKTAFITGGTSGINLGIAKGLARHGARVAVLGRNPDKAAAAAAEIAAIRPGAMAVTADVRDAAALDAAVGEVVRALGPIDFVVAGAAGNFIAPLETISANGFRAVVDIDLMGVFHTFKAVLPHLRTPGAGIIAISAGQATRATWGQAHAAAAKAGIEALVRGAALEWGPKGIRVNGLTPGMIAGTEGIERLMTPENRARAEGALPVGRMGRADEMADAAIYLFSEAASYVTGAILVADGGLALVSQGGAPS